MSSIQKGSTIEEAVSFINAKASITEKIATRTFVSHIILLSRNSTRASGLAIDYRISFDNAHNKRRKSDTSELHYRDSTEMSKAVGVISIPLRIFLKVGKSGKFREAQI